MKRGKRVIERIKSNNNINNNINSNSNNNKLNPLECKREE